VDRGIERGRRLVLQLCRELDETRFDRGLSYAALGRPLGLSGQQVGRICKGRSPDASVARIAQLFALVGLDLSARGYPNGQPFRDAGHIALLERFRARLAPELTWRSEVPVVRSAVDGPPDLRAWDATVSSREWTIGIEAETRVADVQALERRLSLKLRDGAVHALILVLNDTRHHRALVEAAGASIRAFFPTDARNALRALRRGEAPPSSALILL
jgi:transcriptional regulator with XRE-family HTH domain